MGRKCSHCGEMGHNSRTCTSRRRSQLLAAGGSRRLRLFGVQLELLSSSSSSLSPCSMRKSFSMECFSSSCSPALAATSSSIPSSSSSSSRISSSSTTTTVGEISDKLSNGYLSHGLMARAQLERKKGVPWTEKEHRIFLVGMEKLGKGDWRGISKNFVTTRTPTQVASHAQKYFLRQNTLFNKRKRRPSLFDVGRDQLLSLQMVNNNISKPGETSTTTTHHDDPLLGFSAKTMTTVPTSQFLHVKYSSTTISTNLDASKIDHSEWPTLTNHRHDHDHDHHRHPFPVVRTFNESPDSWLQPTFSSSSTKAYCLQSSTSTTTTTPDLELKLGAPMPLNSTNPCPRSLLLWTY